MCNRHKGSRKFNNVKSDNLSKNVRMRYDRRKDVPLQSEVNNTPRNPYGKYVHAL